MYGATCREHRLPAYPCYYRPGDKTMRRAERVRFCPGNQDSPAHILIEEGSGNFNFHLRSVPIYPPEQT